MSPLGRGVCVPPVTPAASSAFPGRSVAGCDLASAPRDAHRPRRPGRIAHPAWSGLRPRGMKASRGRNMLRCRCCLVYAGQGGGADAPAHGGGMMVVCPRSTMTSSGPCANCGPPSVPSRWLRSSATTRQRYRRRQSGGEDGGSGANDPQEARASPRASYQGGQRSGLANRQLGPRPADADAAGGLRTAGG